MIAGDRKQTDEQIIAAIQRVARKIGRTPSANNGRWSYMKHKRQTDVTVVIASERFGGWNAAVEAAGLEPNQSNSTPDQGFGAKSYTDEELLEAVRLAVQKASHGYLTARLYEELQRDQDPCIALIRRRLRDTHGTWMEIVYHCGGISGQPGRPRKSRAEARKGPARGQRAEVLSGRHSYIL